MTSSGDNSRKTLTDRKLGLVGLGRMGVPMARNLLKAGAHLTVFNRTAATTDAFVRDNPGAVAAASPAEVVAAAEITIINVSDTPAVEALMTGPQGLLAGLAKPAQPPRILIDMGTTAPAATRRFAEEIARAGGAYLDAPVSGGVVGAEAGTLSIMVGGKEQDVARARAVLERLGNRVTHVGPSGGGQVAKAANQMIVALTIGAVAEAFALARTANVDLAKLREALMGGFAQSRILDLHGQRMIDGSFEPGGRIRLQRKDVQQALEVAAEAGLELPGTQLNLKLWDEMIERGWGDLDHSALYKLYE